MDGKNPKSAKKYGGARLASVFSVRLRLMFLMMNTVTKKYEKIYIFLQPPEFVSL